jgi:hypothetical protein
VGESEATLTSRKKELLGLIGPGLTNRDKVSTPLRRFLIISPSGIQQNYLAVLLRADVKPWLEWPWGPGPTVYR